MSRDRSLLQRHPPKEQQQNDKNISDALNGQLVDAETHGPWQFMAVGLDVAGDLQTTHQLALPHRGPDRPASFDDLREEAAADGSGFRASQGLQLWGFMLWAFEDGLVEFGAS